MKKIIMSLLMISVLMVSVGFVVASKPLAPVNERAHNGNAEHLYLYEKDPITWEVEDGAWGKITYTDDKYAFNGHKLVAGTEYTLLTYGGWSDVACFGESVVNEDGNFHLNGGYNFELMSDDESIIPVKIWLVLSDDVNCKTGMTHWNPTSYLFEEN